MEFYLVLPIWQYRRFRPPVRHYSGGVNKEKAEQAPIKNWLKTSLDWNWLHKSSWFSKVEFWLKIKHFKQFSDMISGLLN